MKHSKPPIFSIALLCVFACLSIMQADLHASEEGEVGGSLTGEIVLQPPSKKTPFGYDGEIGPDRWGQLDPAWGLCANGVRQSPIDIVSGDAKKQNLPDIQFNYHETPLTIFNNGHTIEVEYEHGSTIKIQNDKYELLQFHFHTPSEHTFENGAGFEVEMHLVHKDAKGNLAVVAVMLQEGHANETFGSIHRFRQTLPLAEGVAYHLETKLNADELLPNDRRYYTYSGSLTTPPCSEGVRWLVIKQPLEVSHELLHALKSALNQLPFASEQGNNARPTQPLNGRKVRFDTRKDSGD